MDKEVWRPRPDRDYWKWRSIRAKVLARDGNRCLYCGKEVDQTAATLDHYYPWARGGSDHPDNLATACIDCNSAKGEMLPLNFIAVKHGLLVDPDIMVMSEIRRPGCTAKRRNDIYE